MAVGGFLTFKDKTEGNVLNNFPADNVMVNIARLYVSRPQPDARTLIRESYPNFSSHNHTLILP